MKRYLLALLLAGFASLAHAQMPIEASGTIAGVEGNRIAIKLDSGDIVMAEVTQTWRGVDGVTYRAAAAPSIIVTGTEDPKNLRPGMFLQFHATLAGKKTVVGEVKAGTLVSATPNTRLGILTVDPVVDEPAADDDKKKPAGNLEDCLILGSITKAKNGSITVAAPGMKPLTFRMAEGAIIDVSGSDMSLARIGDKITASGTVIRLPLFATQEVKIEHSPAVDEKALARKLKPEDVAKPGEEKPMPGNKNPFALGDPDEEASDPAAPKKPKVKLELIKTN